MSTLHYIVTAAALLSTATGFSEAASDSAVTAASAIVLTDKDPGDVVTLKSGRVLKGVKIIEATPFKLYLEVLPSVEPLAIPIKQVVSIQYGTPEIQPPLESSSAKPEDGLDSTNVLQAVKISPDLLKKLNTPITDKTVEFNAQDLVNTLRSAGIMSGVTVTIGPQLEGMPSEKRNVSLSLAGGITFDRFIREIVTPTVPWLKVEYQFDSIYFDCS